MLIDNDMMYYKHLKIDIVEIVNDKHNPNCHRIPTGISDQRLHHFKHIDVQENRNVNDDNADTELFAFQQLPPTRVDQRHICIYTGKLISSPAPCRSVQIVTMPWLAGANYR